MRVLMFSGDSFVLNPHSPVGQRIEEYRKVFGELDVLFCGGNLLSFVSGLIKGFQISRKKKFDVITAQSPEHWFLAWILSRFLRIPWQMQIHTDIFSQYFVQHSMLNKTRVLLAKFLIPRANGIRVVSGRIKESILRTMDYELWTKISVLPIFVDIEKIQNSPIKTDLHQKYPGKFIILIASRLTKEKNISLAVGAVKELANKNPSLILLIVGEGPEKKNFKLNQNVILEGWNDDPISYYKTCDLFLLTSNYEGYGMTLVEAAAARAKVISSDVGIASEILETDNIFKVGDKNALVEKLKLAVTRKVKPAKPLLIQTKEEYLRLYKEGLEQCLKK